MQDLTTDKSEPNVSANPFDLSSQLGDYKEEMRVESTPEVNKPETTTTTESANSWQGNPAYFQTGKKAGQLKPNRLKVSYKKDEQPTEISGELITGALFLTLVDLLFPMLIAFLNNMFAKNKMMPDDLALTDKQLKLLEPVGDRVVAQIKLSANPTVVLLFTMGGLYTMNYMTMKLIKDSK